MSAAPTTPSTGIDPITLEILWTRLTSLVDEAAATFVRTSFSTLVREANDYAVVLLDKTGRNIAQSSQSIPSFICTMPVTTRHYLEEFGAETMVEGDAFLTNDPWLGTGHLNDASMAMPIFWKGELIAFAGVVSHLPDIGGRLRSPGNKNIFEEGLQIPPIRFLNAGTEDKTLVTMIRRNVRVPDQTMGDLWAQVSCCQHLGERLSDLLDETGVDFDTFADEVVDRTEAAMRAAIAEVPDGTYRYVMENDGPREMPGGTIRIACAVTVAGDEITVDYAGSSDQVALSINTVMNYTFAYSAYALKSIFAPWIPNAEGSFLPITITAPEGSILNPRHPASTGARGMMGHLLPPAIFGALAQVVPEQVQAAPGSPSNSFQISNAGTGDPWVLIGFVGAGQGASDAADGTPAISFPSNLSNSPIEAIESLSPFQVTHREIRRGSGGGGKRRGGDGISFEMMLRGDEPATASVIMNRTRSRAQGLNGGGDGALALLQVNGETVDSADHQTLRPGDTLLIASGGGGGFGAE